MTRGRHTSLTSPTTGLTMMVSEASEGNVSATWLSVPSTGTGRKTIGPEHFNIIYTALSHSSPPVPRIDVFRPPTSSRQTILLIGRTSWISDRSTQLRFCRTAGTCVHHIMTTFSLSHTLTSSKSNRLRIANSGSVGLFGSPPLRASVQHFLQKFTSSSCSRSGRMNCMI